MNILGVIPSYPPHSRVGAWITTHEYLAALTSRGHQVDVVSLGHLQTPYTLDGVNVYPRGTETPSPALVISHLGDIHEGARIAEQRGVPSIRFVHGYDHQAAIKLDQAGGTALAVFSSRALAADTAWQGRQMVAHPPIHADRYQTEPGGLVTLSNLSVEKGSELFRFAATALPEVRFLGVHGDHGRQKKAQLPPNVEVINPVEDMRDVYSRTRILLMPSERESYGRVAVEAACSGIPTIAHPSPGLQEAMGDACTWVDRNDLAGWVAAIRYLGDSGAWEEASRRSRRAIQTDPQSTISAVAEAIESTVKVAA